MDEHYLSENIVLKGGNTYYKDKLVKRHNWHLKLQELGWDKLHKQWITKLNKYHNPCDHGQPNNSLFGSLECGDDGDCLFHCVSYALNSIGGEMYDSQDIRNRVAESITQDQFNDIIVCYRSMKDIDDFDEAWDPYEIDTLDEFKEELCKTGHTYWGDHMLLQLLGDVFQINVLILTQNEFTETYEPYLTASIYDTLRNTVVVIHENNSHFKLIGHFSNSMITYFDNNTLPLEFKRLFNL